MSLRKSRELIGKIGGLTSRYNARELNRQLYMTERVKSGNETIYYNVDTLHGAVFAKKKIAFKYFEYSVQKKTGFTATMARNTSCRPTRLPSATKNYYLVSHYEKHGNLTNFRVDKMENIRILSEDAEDISKVTPENFKLSSYTKRLFRNVCRRRRER
ncbi:MAG: WYL domain-containing protein [Clostridiales bacterium]|nr:MAG: WYL domain-containing protein [Clostridiales bacterium]